jgi:hypothetical protein
MTTLSVVIPAYNEERGIRDIAERVLSVRKALREVGVDELELIVVDDGSRDGTAQVAGAIPGVRLIRHPRNRGYGAALKTGFSMAEGELIGFLDADGTYPPEHFPQLCTLALEGQELVIGSRMAGAESKMPLTRRVGNFFFANLLSLVGRTTVTDSASGMRVFHRQVLERIYPLPNGLNLTPVMSTRAIHEGVRMAEVPIPYSERVGRSKLSVIRDGSIFLQSILWTALTYNPVRILGIIGLAGVALGALTGLGLVMARLGGQTTLGPWEIAAIFWGVISAVGGVSLFTLGATFNYLVTLFYRRPIRQGLFGRPIFKTPIENQFGWIGTASLGVGVILGGASLVLSLTGWDLTRLWLYLLGSAMLIFVGLQLLISWILMRVLLELSQRESEAEKDLHPEVIETRRQTA